MIGLKDILLHLEPADVTGNHPIVRYAIGLAERSGAHITALVFDLEVAAPVTLYEGGYLPDMEPIRRAQQEAAAEAVQIFGAQARAAGIPFETLSERAFSTETGEHLARHARLRDLTLLATVPEATRARRQLVEDALFQSARPVVLVPEHVTGFACEHVVVAWDGSAAAARALHDAIPLMTLATRTTIIAISDEKPLHLGETGKELCGHLARHGVDAAFRHLGGEGRPIAEAISSHAQALGADLLVMGAFAHSRLRDLVLGGATRGVLEDCRQATLLSH